MTARPMLSVVIVNYNGGPLLRECLSRLVAAVPPDSGGLRRRQRIDGRQRDRDGGVFPGTRLIRNARNVGYGAANNQALRVARGQFILLPEPRCSCRPGRHLDRPGLPSSEP